MWKPTGLPASSDYRAAVDMKQATPLIPDVHRIDGSLGLLVSVRDAAEARIALAAGVDLIDIKEPRKGALGAANAATIGEIAATVSGRVPVSVALGELRDVGDAELLLDRVAGVLLAKIGLAGVAQNVDWHDRWHSQIARMPKSIHSVAVVYADWRMVGAPPPQEVLRRACEFGCLALLVDTCDKSHGDLLAHWPLDEIRTFVDQVQHSKLLAVIGGSLTAAVLDEIAGTGADYVAVRGAVCRGKRDGPIDQDKLARFVQQVRRCRPVRQQDTGCQSPAKHAASISKLR